MSQQDAIEAYLAQCSPARRADMDILRATVNANLADGFVEAFSWGMIAWEVPLARFSGTYNGKPLLYAGLSSRKAGMSLHLCGLYNGQTALRERLALAFGQAGLDFDMGAACLRLKSLDRVDLAAIGETVAALDVDGFIAAHLAAHPPKKAKASKNP